SPGGPPPRDKLGEELRKNHDPIAPLRALGSPPPAGAVLVVRDLQAQSRRGLKLIWRFPAALLLAGWSVTSIAGAPKQFKMPPDFDYDRHYAKLAANPPHLSAARLPKGYKIGKCLLVVDGQTRISGPCAYILHKGGEFHIAGPRQVYDGIDYPKAEIGAMEMSTDWWASVFKDEDGNWTGYGNENVRYTKGDGSAWYELVKSGACFSNETRRQPSDTYQQRVKLCLWKK
ncbi:hypothetical protein, partial [Sphingorhabdus sp.]|uniref:hypothetical protein n=1 Tax=Sphingorhabdus sp. TaxID=1902408 RepID=UPI003BAE4D3B